MQEYARGAVIPRKWRQSHSRVVAIHVVTCERGSGGGGQHFVHHRLSFADNCVEVPLVLEAFRVNLLDGLGAQRPGHEPAAARDYIETIDRNIVALGHG